MKYLFIFLFSATCILNASGQANDEKGVKNTLDAFITAWNKHDAEAFANVFAEDADFTNVAGKNKRGREEIKQHHAPSFQTKWKDSFQKITQSKIRFLKPDVAAVDAWWELTGIKGPNGQEMPARKGLLNFVMTKQKNTWFITVMHNTELKEDAADSNSSNQAVSQERVMAELRKLDSLHAAAVLTGNVQEMDNYWTEDFIVNNPFNEIDRADRVRNGTMTYQSFQRICEEVRIHGNTAILMGREIVVPKGTSPGAGKTITRRYTNIWMSRDGNWRLVARHASNVCNPN